MIEATLSAALLASALLPGSSTPVARDLDSLFPPATKAMVVTSGPDSEKFTYYDLVRQYAQATDQEVSMTEATKGLLRSRSVDLSRSFVPVEQVQHTFETLLASAGFVLSPPKVPEVPIIGIWSKEGLSAARCEDRPFGADQVARAASTLRLFTATIDCRTPTPDSWRIRFEPSSDSNTSRSFAGASTSMVLVGLGEQSPGSRRP